MVGTGDHVSKGGELITVVVRNVNATMKNIDWQFRQTYFPFLKGGGKADSAVIGASFCIGFIVARDSISTETERNGGDKLFNTSSANYRPMLVVSTASCSIEALDLTVHGNWLSFVYNTISDMFSKTIKNYVVSMLTDTILERVCNVQDTLNDHIHSYWDKLNTVLEIDLQGLPEMADALEKCAARSAGVSDKYTYSVSFTKPGTIGVRLQQSSDGLYVSVAGMPRGPNGEILPGEQSGKIVVGHVLVAVNGYPVTSLPLDRVINRIKRVGRPLTLSFSDKLGSRAPMKKWDSPIVENVEGGLAAWRDVWKERAVVSIEFKEKRLHLLATPWVDVDGKSTFSTTVTGFSKTQSGGAGPAEMCGKVPRNSIIYSINGISTVGKTFLETMQVFKAAGRPITLSFARNCDAVVSFAEAPTDIIVEKFQDEYVVVGFKTEKGPAEKQYGDILEKDMRVVSVNGKAVSGMSFGSVVSMMTSPRPMSLAFSTRTGILQIVLLALDLWV